MRPVPDPGFAGDNGAAAPEVAAALAAYAQDPAAYPTALSAIQGARLLVPVVAMLDEVEYDDAGRAREKPSDMAVVMLRGRGGRVALLAFTGSASLTEWNPEARPVPVTAALAARSALHDGAEAMVVDVAGPVRLVVEGADLRSLAEGWTLATVGERHAWVRPESVDDPDDDVPGDVPHDVHRGPLSC